MIYPSGTFEAKCATSLINCGEGFKWWENKTRTMLGVRARRGLEVERSVLDESRSIFDSTGREAVVKPKYHIA